MVVVVMVEAEGRLIKHETESSVWSLSGEL